MPYSNDNARWKAYQFSDPFAAGSFIVCNKVNKSFCRPDCEARPVTNLRSEIKFVNDGNEALALGFMPCVGCDPCNPPSVEVELLVRCVETINQQIGFVPPLINDDEDVNNERIKENINEAKKFDSTVNSRSRRASVPVVNQDGKYPKDAEDGSLSKNDSDHYRLVDLACRHLSLAAAMNIFNISTEPVRSPSSPRSPSSAEHSPSRKRRRRGGVLGFKELAAKSKLSAWHFHRVFKSVTGLTPKTYGDKCWEYIKTYKSEHNLLIKTSVTPPESSIATPTFPSQSPGTKEFKNKRAKIKMEDLEDVGSGDPVKHDFTFINDQMNNYSSSINDTASQRSIESHLDTASSSHAVTTHSRTNSVSSSKDESPGIFMNVSAPSFEFTHFNNFDVNSLSSHNASILDSNMEFFESSNYLNSQLAFSDGLGDQNYMLHQRAFSAPEISSSFGLNLQMESVMTDSLFKNGTSQQAQQQLDTLLLKEEEMGSLINPDDDFEFDDLLDTGVEVKLEETWQSPLTLGKDLMINN